jgi:TolB-like protein/Flp pilus assembly protein TadD
MTSPRKLAALLAADVVGYSRLTGVDEERILARLRALRSDLIDPTIAVHHGRVVKRTGDGAIVEFRSAVDALRCAIEVQNAMIERNAGVPENRRIVFRIGVHVGDVVEEADGDLMGDAVNVAARLEGICEPGAVCLSGAAYEQVRDKVNETFADLGETPLKNIARPVAVYAVKTQTPVASVRERSGPPRLSIVVLPFANIGGDASQDYFVDGVTESLTTDLSRIPGAFVIARNTAFTFKGKPVEARKLGLELGVRYALEGSMQTGGNRMRVNAQLIDTETGAHLWAERFDKPRADLFDMQDEIISRLARSVGVELVAAEGRRADLKQPHEMDAFDFAMRGLACMNRHQSQDNLKEARVHFEAALEIDGRSVPALTGLAHSHIEEVRIYVSTNPAEQLRLAKEAISKASAIAPDDAHAHCVQGELWHVSSMPDRAMREFEFAISLDRNLAAAHAGAGFGKVLLGQAEEAEGYISEAIRLSPRDPRLDQWMGLMGIADTFLGKFDQAEERLRRSAGMNPNVAINHFFLAASLAMIGRASEASEAVTAGRRLDPNFTVSRFRAGARSSNPVYLRQREGIYEGMRKAGVPEG